MTSPTIRAYFEQDHDRLDELFRIFQTMKRTEFSKAKGAFKDFKFGLQRHIVWEEEILFPLWEQQTGMTESGPTVVMRAEHRQIGAVLEAIHKKVQEQDPESDAEEEQLLSLLGAHNMKEERILYPAIDQAVSDADRESVYRRIKELPEERYRVCCGESR